MSATTSTPFKRTDRASEPVTPNGSTERIKAEAHDRLLATIDFNEAQRMPREALYDECSRRVDQLLGEQRCPLSAREKNQLLVEVMDEVFGMGPIEALMRDSDVSDILVNGPSQIYIERNGRLEETDARFRDDAHLLQVIQRTAAQVGRHVDESSPMLDARLHDGSRVNAIIPPLALDGPVMSIRRFGTIPFDPDKLIEIGTMAPEMALFLEACVRCRRNILISGGTGSGKSTLLNVLSKWIPDHERLVTIEDAAELQLQRKHVVRLETRMANVEGRGEITQRDLLRNTLRMRPDRIIIGEVRGAEAIDMLQAMNTGHEGSMTTVHSNTARDALRRIETMVSMSGLTFPVQAIRQQMASALDVLVHLTRVAGGQRKVVSISEVTGMEGEVVCLQELFRYQQTGMDSEGNSVGHFEACGSRPQLMSALQERGVELPSGLFQRRRLNGRVPGR